MCNPGPREPHSLWVFILSAPDGSSLSDNS
uniref:Uncharacterized protein n=1 Tax=Anguilla anguilla TaxID=7936 RepID=A0A0E9TD94_ANGAN